MNNRWDIINHIIDKYKYTRYLEIGFDTGYNFDKINCKEKISIDPGAENKTERLPIHKCTSDYFFEHIASTYQKFDIVFIDGLHHTEQVDLDISNSFKFLNDGGTVVLHDCNPPNETAQITPRKGGEWTGDVWKSIVKFRMNSDSNVGTFVIDTDYGIGIISSRLKYAPLTSVNMEYTYSYLDKNRKQLLNLVSVSEIHSIFK